MIVRIEMTDITSKFTKENAHVDKTNTWVLPSNAPLIPSSLYVDIDENPIIHHYR